MSILKSKDNRITWLEINKKNLLHNVEQFRKIAPNSQIWPVVKSNAYGHGLKEVVKVLDKDKNVSGFAVVNLDEAVAVNKISKKPIMVLSYFSWDKKGLVTANRHKISLPVYDYETIDQLNDLGKKLKKDFWINIKIDTGTTRLGFRAEEADKAIEHIRSKKHIKVFSMFTHYAESEAKDLTFSNQQLQRFNQVAGKYFDIKVHSACSAASINMENSQQDIIRLGISLYGLWPSLAARQNGESQGIELKPVLRWKTKIIQLKDALAGDTVGYNRTYKCEEDCKIAVLPVGYNEGYSRLFSNQAEVLIRGQRYKVRGNICMNLCMLELPQDTDIKVGEEVVLLGHSKKETLGAEDLAQWSRTINYEVVTKINPELPRIIV
ncbi:alanine racemase [Candidatus Parcubacteria bacterium]|nr:MAG: alanine racemase [Candidatus Parcubacteria bacterium]